jgi:hypothetical protein
MRGSVKQDWKQREALELPGFEVVKKNSKTITVGDETYNTKEKNNED